MKAIATIGVAAALLLGSAAYAQTNSTNSTNSTSNTDATSSTGPSDAATMNANPPSSHSATSGSSTQTDTSATPHSVAAACKKEATDMKLSGSEKTKFIKNCKEGKTSREGRTNPPPQ